jgi:P2 family phage contractile tail tube protein
MDNIVRGGNWYFDALNLWRVLDEVELPEIKHAVESFTPAGHMMGVEWPEEIEAMKAMIKTKNNDPRLRALCGRQPGNYVAATYYENLVSYRDGTNRGRLIILRGLMTEVKQAAVKGLKIAGVDYTFSTLVYYHDLYDGRSVHKFDYFAGPGETIVDGERPFAGMAANLAISGGTAL